VTEYRQKPHLLVQDDRVEFSPSWPSEIEQSGKYYRVHKQQVVNFDKFWIIDSDNTYDFRIDEDTGLLPTEENTLYQVLISIKGNVMLFPQWPEGKYVNQLQKVGYRPFPSKVDKRYLGGYDSTDSPYGDPHLVEFLVKGMNPIVYRFYNDSIVPEKVVVRFKINKIKLKEISERREPIREIYFVDDYQW